MFKIIISPKAIKQLKLLKFIHKEAVELAIDDLKNDLFSYNSGMMMDIKDLLKNEITKEIWDSFIGQIKYCEGIEYVTVSRF